MFGFKPKMVEPKVEAPEAPKSKYELLVDKLIEETKNSKLDWEESYGSYYCKYNEDVEFIIHVGLNSRLYLNDYKFPSKRVEELASLVKDGHTKKLMNIVNNILEETPKDDN